MKVLLDTDIVLDIVLDRVPFVDEASAIWLAHEEQLIAAYIAPITPINVFYIVRKLKGTVAARDGVGVLINTLKVCLIDQHVLQRAYALPISDFEDATQVAAAIAASVDAIVTRNTSDFRASPMLVLSPTELLARLNKPAS